MTNQPFTPNTPQKIEKMAEAANHIYAAITALIEAKKSAENWTEYETLNAFTHQLKEFMNCDGGEAGFEIFLENEAAHSNRAASTVYNRRGNAVQVTVPED